MYIVRDSPRSGVEIMNIMESNLQGWWRPSPGSIYPMLKRMVDEGVLSRSKEDKYSLTPVGKEEIDNSWPWQDSHGASPTSIEGAVETISSYTSYLEDLARNKDPKLSQSAKPIRELADRLAKVGESS
jgi:DNA-binding PadR family transcriptional regulator